MKPSSSSSSSLASPRSLALVLSSIVGGGILVAVLHRQGILILPVPLQRLLKRQSHQKGQPLPREAAERIITHMNIDHGAHLVLYAKHYAGLTAATAASIISIDSAGMDLSVSLSSTTTPRLVRVSFPQGPLASPKDARVVLAAMAEEAGKALGVSVKTEEAEAEMLAKLDPLTDTQFGLDRVEMGSKKCLAGTVKKYDTHVFVLWKKATDWPKNVEDGEKGSTDISLPQALHAALKKHARGITTGKAKLNVAECCVEEGDEEGTLLLFPQEVCVTGVTVENAEKVVEALLVGGEEGNEDGEEGEGLGERVAEARDRLEGIEGVGVKDRIPRKHLFVCCHLKRDKRCGLVGPYLIKEFRRLIKAQEGKEGENDDVFEFECPVRACSHVGGHAYAGNVISFSRREKEGGREGGRVVGDWWGYVTPVIAKEMVERHLVKGELLESVWRGQMGLGEEEQKGVAQKEAKCEGCDCGKGKTEL